MDICPDHAANQERFDRIDNRLSEHDTKVDRHDRLIERQIALMEGQVETNKRLESSVKALESRPSRFFDLMVGAVLTGIVAFVLVQLGLGA